MLVQISLTSLHPVYVALQVGASHGHAAIRAHAADWAMVFDLAPGHMLMPFLRCLVAPVRGGSSVAAAFGSKAMDALARILLAEGGTEAARDQALPLLVDWCQVLNPKVRPRPPRASG